MFKSGEDYLPAANAFGASEGGGKGQVVGLCAAAGKDDLPGRAAERRRHLRAGFLHGLLCEQAHAVQGGRVAELLREHARHDGRHLRRHARGRRIIQVNCLVFSHRKTSRSILP